LDNSKNILGEGGKISRANHIQSSSWIISPLTKQTKQTKENYIMKILLKSLTALALLTVTAFAGDLVNVAGASNVALSGYDPVAFFTDSKPVNGSPSISSEYQGATYFFANEDHKNLFAANPEKYAPQCGGFCAFGVSVGALFPVDISTWQIRNGKLYLNLNQDILKKFNADFDANVAKADKNWPGLVKKNG
jgi:YHS domain-containing protein